MNDKLKNIAGRILSVAAAAVLVFLCLRHVSLEDFSAALENCRWTYVLLSMAIGALSLWFRAVRWRMLLHPIDPSISLGTSFNSVGVGYLANLAVPRAGEFVRCGFITRASAKGQDGRRKASYEKVIGTVVLERAWDTLTLFACLFMTLAFTWRRFGGFFKENIFGQVMGSLSVSWILLFVAVASFAGLTAVWALRNRIRIFSRVWSIVRGIWEGVVSCMKMKSGWLFIVLTVGIWVCYWMMAATIVWAVQGIGGGTGTMDLVDALFLMVVGSISSLVPVPGGFGAYHYLISLALQSIYGIPMSVGLAFATLSHESQALIQLLCGAWGYFRETLKGNR